MGSKLRVHPAIAVAFIVLCLGLLVWLLFPIIRLVGQWLAVVALLLAFRYWPPMFAWVKAMPVPHRTIFGLILAAMILGHLTIRSRAWFPFVPWYIFPAVREEDPVTCREFIGTTASGQKVRLLVEQLFPSVVQFNPPDDAYAASMDHLVRAMAKAYNKQHGNDPVRQVDLVVMAVKLHPPATEWRQQPTCELLKQYDLSSGR